MPGRPGNPYHFGSPADDAHFTERVAELGVSHNSARKAGAALQKAELPSARTASGWSRAASSESG